jgi:heme exporter protein C
MKTLLAWLLWLWISLVIVGAFFYAPVVIKGFRTPGSSRILFFHVPMAWASFLGFMAAAVWSMMYLLRRKPRHDRAAAVAIEVGLLFGILATVTGAMWAKIEWGEWWNWDPRQISILAVILFYGAYLALRQAVEEPETRGRLAAAYALFGVVVTPFFFWVMPRIVFSLHPDPVVNPSGKVDMDAPNLQVLLASGLGFCTLFFWIHNLQCRLESLAERRAALKE